MLKILFALLLIAVALPAQASGQNSQCETKCRTMSNGDTNCQTYCW